MDTPSVLKPPWKALLCLPIGTALHFTASFTLIWLIGEPIEPAAFVCSLAFAIPGIIVATVLLNTKRCNLRTVSVCMLIGWMLVGSMCGVMGAITDVRHGMRNQLPLRTAKMKVAEGIMTATFGVQIGIVGGALLGWIIAELAPRRSRKPFTGRSPKDSSNITT